MNSSIGAPVEAIRDALRDWAHSASPDRWRWTGEEQRAWDRADLARALRAREVCLDAAQLDLAFKVLRQRSFMGGNYTLDAKAVLAKLAEE